MCSVERRCSASVTAIGSEEFRCSNNVTVKVQCGEKVHFMCVSVGVLWSGGEVLVFKWWCSIEWWCSAGITVMVY
jgi:hypothetical protein